ncbi:MAG: NAD-dependent epimerase/dehydratase family protein [Candidatus Hodarchaeota archaeon]
MMEIIVTGANGFIGSHLCKFLVEKGENVHAMVRETSDLTLLKDLNPNLKGINIVYGDITDIDSLKQNFKEKDVIINLAGIIKGLKQEDFDRVNVQGYINVCEALLEVNPDVKRVVMASSMAGAGPSPPGKVLTEDDPPTELKGDLYGLSKQRMEREIKPYMGKLPISIVRPPMVFGPGDVPSLDMYKQPKNGRKVVVGKEPKFYSLVAVSDLCEGIYAMITNPKAVGEIFYFTTGDPVEWGELQEIIGKVAFNRQKPLKTVRFSPKLAIGVGSLLEFFGKIMGKVPFLNKTKMIEGSASGWAFSSKKAESMLGWKPKHTMESWIKEAVDWYQEHGWL